MSESRIKREPGRLQTEKKPETVENTYTDEFRLVLETAVTEGVDTAAIRDLLARDINWQRFYDLTRRHRVFQLVYESFQRVDTDEVPEALLDTLEEHHRRTSLQNLSYVETLYRVLELAAENDIRVLPYKGPVVATLGYEGLSVRSFGDIDILIERSQITDFKKILRQNGYTPEYELNATDSLTDAQEYMYITSRRDYRLRETHTDNIVELQWRPVSLPFPHSGSLDDFWDRRSVADINGREVPVLSPEDRIVILTVHGSRHLWERLKWVCDINELLRRTEIDWETVLRRARKQNCVRMVTLGVVISHKLFGSPLPTALRDRYENDSVLQAVTSELLASFDAEIERGEPQTRRLQSRLLDRRRDRLRFWLLWALNPEHEDIERTALPYALLPLYSVFRMKRAVRTYFQKYGRPWAD